MKKNFERKAKPNDFQQGDLVLKWDSRHEGKGKHDKFDHFGRALIRLERIEKIILMCCKRKMVISSQEGMLMVDF